MQKKFFDLKEVSAQLEKVSLFCVFIWLLMVFPMYVVGVRAEANRIGGSVS